MANKGLFYVFLSFWLVVLTASPCFSDRNAPERLPQTQLRTALQGSDLFDRIAEAANSVRDLSAQVDFRVRLYNVGLTFNVGADLYYKQPDKVRLKLHDLPDFLLRRQNVAYQTASILASLRHDLKSQYNPRIINQAAVEGQNCYLIQLTPKKPDGVSRILVWVNSANYTTPRIIIHFDDGSNLTQQKLYAKENDVYVIQSMDSDYDAPDMKAQILTTFRNYQINKGLADGVFDPRKRENNPISAF